MPQVLLLNMPFVSVQRPSIALGLLKAQLEHLRWSCRVGYANLLFAKDVGVEVYRFIDETLGLAYSAGDWLFARHLFGERPEDDEYLDLLRQHGSGSVETILGLSDAIERLLDDCIDRYRVDQADIVGFSTTFQQNLASLALARRVKDRFPGKLIVFGGANCEGDMGLELHRSFPWIDCVFQGEADHSFPDFVGRVAGGLSLDGVPGLIYRRNGESVIAGKPQPVLLMDELPVPDFDDYFHALDEYSIAADVRPSLVIETARGCWWGAKSHCTFCGLNGATMAFRHKSAPRVLAEIAAQKERYGIHHFVAVDNIMPHRYFSDLLPMLKERALGVTFFYEIKSNLTRQQVRLLSESGVRLVQPGIESLHTHVLRLMRKGVSAIQNVQTLKWCREYGITVAWNLLYGFPGETPEDYDETAALVEAICHLPPPEGASRIRLDRFSPYFSDPTGWGMSNVRPFDIYRLLYPLNPERIARIAYFFEYDYQDGRDPSAYTRGTVQAIDRWSRRDQGDLTMDAGTPSKLVLTDTRCGRTPASFELNGIQRDIYLRCDEATAYEAIRGLTDAALGPTEAARGWLDGFLAQMLEYGLMMREGKRYLSLAVAPGSA